MFGDTDRARKLAERLLNIMDIGEILEHNDLNPEDLLTILIDGGHIGEPSGIIENLEDYES